jgi:hypothetical protein
MKLPFPSPPTARQAFTAGWCVANLLGALVFLAWSASCCWIEPELKDVPGASGGAAFVWALGPLPIFAAFVLADLAWAIRVESKAASGRRLSALAVPLLVLIGWASVFVIDGVHHGS